MTGATPGPAVTRDPTRARILDAARELFGSQGFDSTTVRQIATRVGIRDAALYHHFRSKREILNAVWDIPNRGVAAFKADGPLNRRRLDQIMNRAITFIAQNDNFQRLTYREILGGDQTALALRQRNRSVLRLTLYEHLCTIHNDDEADIRTEAILAFLTGVTIMGQIRQGQDYKAHSQGRAYMAKVRSTAARLAFEPMAGTG